LTGAALASSTLSVALDLRHPLAYLALGPTRAFARRRGLEPNWLPLTVPTLNPPSPPEAGDDRGARHRRYRAQAIAREIAVYAEAQGLVLHDPYRQADAGAANGAWLWVRDRRPEALGSFLETLFRAYWAAGLDPSDPDAVAALVDATGADAAGFRAWYPREGEDALASLAAELGGYGLFQVPAFVVQDEVFYGRQHLPMIEWILDGRAGPVPI
jgi:2-hydroxychromene-2-carboxylate isomerase